MESFLTAAGTQRSLAKKYRDEYKFVWAKKLFADLSLSVEGIQTLKRILTELCKLKNLPDKDVKDRNAGLDSLRKLKALALEHDLIIETQQKDTKTKAKLAEEKASLLKERAKILENLKNEFNKEICNPNRQSAGYSLEDIIKELFSLFKIDYRKSYKIKNQQIDGQFHLNGFDYLVEARWRKDYPTAPEIYGCKGKVDSKIESTRGFFVSVIGFKDDVIRELKGEGSKIIFMDGEDLVHILEGRVDLNDALKLKIDKAAQEGEVFSKLLDHFKK